MRKSGAWTSTLGRQRPGYAPFSLETARKSYKRRRLHTVQARLLALDSSWAARNRARQPSGRPKSGGSPCFDCESSLSRTTKTERQTAPDPKKIDFYTEASLSRYNFFPVNAHCALKYQRPTARNEQPASESRHNGRDTEFPIQRKLLDCVLGEVDDGSPIQGVGPVLSPS